MAKKKYMPQVVFNGCVIIAMMPPKDELLEAVERIVDSYRRDFPDDIDLRNDILKATFRLRDQNKLEIRVEDFEKIQGLNSRVGFGGGQT